MRIYVHRTLIAAKLKIFVCISQRRVRIIRISYVYILLLCYILSSRCTADYAMVFYLPCSCMMYAAPLLISRWNGILIFTSFCCITRCASIVSLLTIDSNIVNYKHMEAVLVDFNQVKFELNWQSMVFNEISTCKENCFL